MPKRDHFISSNMYVTQKYDGNTKRPAKVEYDCTKGWKDRKLDRALSLKEADLSSISGITYPLSTTRSDQSRA